MDSVTTTAIDHHMDLWLVSDIILNSSPLLFFTLSLLFLPLTLTTTTTFLHDDVITPTPYDVIKTLTTFTAATSLIILRTTHPRLTLISAVKSFPPLFITVVTETALLLLSALAIAFSPFAVSELLGLGLGFDGNLVKLGVVFVVVVSVVYLMVIWGFSAPVSVLEGRYGFAALRESERRMVRFRGRSFLMVLSGVFRIGPLLLSMSVVAKGSTVLVVNRCAVQLLLSLVITHHVVMYTILYVLCRVSHRDFEVSGYVDGDYKDDDKVGGGQGFTLLFHFVLFVWVGTMMTSLFGKAFFV